MAPLGRAAEKPHLHWLGFEPPTLGVGGERATSALHALPVFLRVVVARILLINSLYKMSGLAPLHEQYTNTKALLFYMLQA